MTPRRIRKARQLRLKRTVVVQVPERLDMQTAAQIGRLAREAFPGRRVILLDRGITAVST